VCVIYIFVCEVKFAVKEAMKAYDGAKEWLHTLLKVALVGSSQLHAMAALLQGESPDP